MYSDDAIDAAIRSACGGWDQYHARKAKRVRAKMIAMRDGFTGTPRGETPTSADLHLALTLRAKDLMGFTDPASWY